MTRIPFYRQKNDYYCGPAAMQMTLGAFGISRTQRALARRARTNARTGTSARALVNTLRAEGLFVRGGERRTLSDIRRALGAGAVVIVCFTEPSDEEGHYAVVRSLSDTHIALLDPWRRGGALRMARTEFLHRWKDPRYTKTSRFAALISRPRR